MLSRVIDAREAGVGDMAYSGNRAGQVDTTVDDEDRDSLTLRIVGSIQLLITRKAFFPRKADKVPPCSRRLKHRAFLHFLLFLLRKVW